MTALPAKILSDVFADGELTNEVKWYNRIFAVINQIIDYLSDDTGWLDVPVKAGFAQLAGNPLQVRMKRGTVRLRGGLANTGMAASGSYSCAGPFPAGIPGVTASTQFFTVASSTGDAGGAAAILDGTGNVSLRLTSTLGAYYEFNNISFWID